MGVLFIRGVFASFIGFLQSRGIIIALPLLVMGCAHYQELHVAESVLVTLPTYQTKLTSQETYSGSSTKIFVASIKDVRKDILGDFIGERKSFNASMGEIEMRPIPAKMIEQVLKSELSALGNTIVDSGEEFRIDGQINEFKIVTPNTISYWDVNGEIDLDLAVINQAGKVHNSHYMATCTDRTYVWPSENIIRGVVTGCLEKIAESLQNDSALADFFKE